MARWCLCLILIDRGQNVFVLGEWKWQKTPEKTTFVVFN